MERKKDQKRKAVWLLVLLLFICVALSTVAIVGLMNAFMPDDEGAISLVETDEKSKGDSEGGKTPDGTQKPDSTSTTPTTTTAPPVTGMIAYDDKGVWKKKTNVELFKVSYENGEAVVTVQSADGSKVIAPGTENSYTFKLKNTGEVAMDYTLEVDAVFAPEGIEIPIAARLCRYDRKWVVGNRDGYASVAKLNAAKDNATLGAGRYTYYTLDWSWPYEGDTDEMDTMLGSLAKEQELTFTISIHTIARASDDPEAGGGILPQTGDSSKPVLWTCIAAISFVLIFLPLIPVRRKRRDESEA